MAMSKRNTLLSLLAGPALVLPLVSCGGSAHDSPENYYLVAADTKIPYWQAAAAGLGPGGSAHDSTEIYYLVAANTKIPYWQAAAAGFGQAATDLKVRSDLVGPDTHDPQAELQQFVKVVREKKPPGILVSAAASQVLKPEIDKAIAPG